MLSMKLHDTNGAHVILRFKTAVVEDGRSFTFCELRHKEHLREIMVDKRLYDLTPSELYEIAETMFSEFAKSQDGLVFLEAGYTLYGRKAHYRLVSKASQTLNIAP